ncbi:MAG TPA: DUF5702 domain-containing protein [Methanosarcinales archaeon]|nr:DUF5702 domain-containing protein [Methanosarcinales archaeon]
MHNNNDRGAITVYLSIILSAVIMLSGVLMDIARIRAAEVQVRRAANTAANSALAGYDTKFKEEYGLFALHSSDTAYLNETTEDYFGKNLLSNIEDINGKHQMYHFLKGIMINNQYKDVDFIDLYNYKIESIEVTPVYNFTENEITRQQIVEYMKYRAPVQFAENFMGKIDYVASSGDLTSSYKQKTTIEKKLGNIEKAMKRLQKHIDEINKFEIRNFDSSPGSNSQLIKNTKNIVLKEIYKGCKKANFGNLETPEKEKAFDIMQRIDELYEDARKQSENGIDLLDEQLWECLNAIKGGILELENIKALSKQARQDMESLKSILQDLKSQNKPGEIENTVIIDAMQKDIDKYEKLLDTDNSQSIALDLNNNLEALNQIQTSISNLPSWVAKESKEISKGSLDSLENSFRKGANIDIVDQHQYNAFIRKLASNTKIKSIYEAANSYKTISNILDIGKSSKGVDPRKSAAEAVKKIRKEIQDATGNPKKIEDPKLLPSYVVSGSYPNKIYSEDILEAQEPNYDEAEIVEEFDADFDEDSTFVDESFDYIINFAKKLKDKAMDLRNEIYVNEYILKIFKDVVEINDSNTDGKSKSTFFEKGEVEYIIGGNSNEEINKYLVKGQILLIRFGMNTLHVYSDSEKRLQALEVATTVAGFTGFGIPIAHNLIMCAWGSAEAVCDIKDIYDGKKVPFIKTIENWRTDLLPSGFKAKDGAESESGLMDFDYHDYLRLLLLVKDKEAKMNRIEDLIQLNVQQVNTDFKLNSCNTYIKINAEISIKYWFITKLFVSSKNKTIDGDRHIINVEVWRGY